MRERLVTLACALGALALFIVMFARSEHGFAPRRETPRPTTAEQRGNGYYAAMRWLHTEQIRTLSLRHPFDTLATAEPLAARGNLLIVTLPHSTPFTNAEHVAIDRWIRAGNTLLVAAALSDSPDWSFLQGGLGTSELSVLTGLEFEAVRQGEERPRGTLVANGPHAYFEGVRSAIGLSDYPAQSWTVKIPYEGFVLSLAHQSETGEGILWTRTLGEGRIIVSGFSTLFTNRALGLADNAQLLANIVGTSVGPGGTVIFDDVHQGLGAGYDPDSFYRDGRLLSTVWILLGLWLAWVLGATRLRIPAAPARVPRESELVRTTGAFFSRVLRPGAAALRLIEHFFLRLRARQPGGRSGAASPHDTAGFDAWRYLERHPHVSARDLAQLRAWYDAAGKSRRVPLVGLQNLLVRLERQVS